MERIKKRKDQLARVLDPFKDSIDLEKALSLLEKLRSLEVKELKIQFLLNAFGRDHESLPESVPAFYHKDEYKLYFVQRDGYPPWTSIARQLALAISPEIDPGQIASGFKEVLSAGSDDDAKIILDELGFAPLERGIGKVIGVLTPVEDFGGKDKQGEEITTVEEAIKRLFGRVESGPSAEIKPSPGEKGELPSTKGQSFEGEHERETAARKKKGRLRTYVYPEGSVYEGGLGSGIADEYSAVDKAGIDRVVEFEKDEGRFPVVMPPKHPGYDIESKDETGNTVRYIEVKSLSGDWGMTGVTLTKPQFEKAIDEENNYWLYIVERAQQEDFKIHRIQNPAQRVEQFIYDDGWKNLAEDAGKINDENRMMN
jgi:hypothetical protein